MKRISICLVVMAVLWASASPALADEGGGLYEPAPEPASKEQAREFIKGLPGGREIERRLTERQLDEGVRLRGAGDRTSPATARRAGIGSGSDFVDGWPLALAMAAAVLAAAGWRTRRRA